MKMLIGLAVLFAACGAPNEAPVAKEVVNEPLEAYFDLIGEAVAWHQVLEERNVLIGFDGEVDRTIVNVAASKCAQGLGSTCHSMAFDADDLADDMSDVVYICDAWAESSGQVTESTC